MADTRDDRCSWLPIAGWLPQYPLAWLRSDLVAGVTLAAYAVPVSLAYAGLAGLPPQTGLYCYLLAGLGYALFGSSRHLAIGPTSAISLLLGVTLAGLAAGDPARQATLASLTALIVAVVFALAWLLRLSVLVNFISESILAGFKAGAALVIASTQLPKLFGVRGGGDDFFQRLGQLVEQVPGTSLPTLAVGAGAILALVLGERFLPGRPVALGVVLLALVGASLGRIEQRGVKVVGPLPAGLPHFQVAGAGLGVVRTEELRQLTRLAFACFLLAYIESVSAARTFALRHRYAVDARQEFLGLGAANLLVGLWQGFPVAGGLSQSAVNEKAGARTPLSLVVAAAVIALVLLFFTGLFQSLPEAVLAAIVLVAVRGLIDLRELRYLWHASRIDFAAAGVALVGVLVMWPSSAASRGPTGSPTEPATRRTRPSLACCCSASRRLSSTSTWITSSRPCSGGSRANPGCSLTHQRKFMRASRPRPRVCTHKRELMPGRSVPQALPQPRHLALEPGQIPLPGLPGERPGLPHGPGHVSPDVLRVRRPLLRVGTGDPTGEPPTGEPVAYPAPRTLRHPLCNRGASAPRGR
jgi:high affinity sulfate transporter 1